MKPRYQIATLCVALCLCVRSAGALEKPQTSSALEPSVKPFGPPAPLTPPSASARYGSIDFDRYCASCHGKAGEGRGTSAKRFDNWATDFKPGVYKCRSTPSGSLPTDSDLRRSMQWGLAGTGMPEFIALSPLQLDHLVETLKYFSPRFSVERPGSPIVIPPEPPNDDASIAGGAHTYEALKCANCHGWRGEGGPAAAPLRNDNGSPAHVTDFTRPYSLKCGDSSVAIYTTLMTGMDGTPMSAYADVVSPEDAWHLVHFVQSLRQ